MPMVAPDVLAAAVKTAYDAVAYAEEIAWKRRDEDIVIALKDARDALASVAGRLRRRAQEGGKPDGLA